MIVLAALLLLACRNEEKVPVKGSVSFSFVFEGEAGAAGGVAGATAATGALGTAAGATRAVDGTLVKDLNLYVVNGAGAVVEHVFVENAGDAQATIYNNETYTVYAVVNGGYPMPQKTAVEIESMMPALSSACSSIVMTGKTEPLSLSDGDEIEIPVKRCAAKIVVKGDYSQLSPGVTINIRSVMLRNIPNSIKLFGKSAIVSAAGAQNSLSVENPTAEEFARGVEFYQYENMQGTLLPGNTDQKLKVWPQGNLYSQLCSYVYMEAEYSSEQKQGRVIYRFYLGKDMTSNYDVERNMIYTVNVVFKGNGGIDESTWRVDASGLVDVLPPEISFGQSSVPMYDLQERNLEFARLETRGKELEVSSSDNSVVQVLEYSSSGIKVRALAPGVATVTASAGGVSAECKVNVEKLRIVPATSSITLFNHFYEDIGYTVYPPHAASLGVSLLSGTTSLVVGYGGVPNKVIPQYDINTPLPVQQVLTLQVNGRSDVYAQVPVEVYPMISIADNVTVNANMGNSVTEKDLNLKTSPHAQVSASWAPSDGVSIYGTPPEGVEYSNGRLRVDVPTSANGRYRLVCNVVGDDGYGSLGGTAEDASVFCDVEIYETIYLVGVSKSHGRERLSASPDRWKYYNEVLAKWFTHPQSLLFPNGEVQMLMNFIYNGVEYSDSHTAFYEENVFEFVEGETYEYAMGKGTFEYRGTPPKYYYQYFSLQPASSPYIEGSLADNTPYIYVCSRNFASGFGADDIPGWETIFEYIYPQ